MALICDFNDAEYKATKLSLGFFIRIARYMRCHRKQIVRCFTQRSGADLNDPESERDLSNFIHDRALIVQM
jgi:hypothetical protein